MELNIIQKDGRPLAVLLDDDMRIIKPVYDYLKYLRLKDRKLNTLKANGRDLKIYWDFLNRENYRYDEVTPMVISEFIEYLRFSDNDNNIIGFYAQSQRSGKTINRILSSVYNFYKYCGMIKEIHNPIIMEEVERSFDMFKSLLHHAKSNNKTSKSLFKVKENKRPFKIVTTKESKAFIEALPSKRDKLIFKILYLTGARIGEVLELTIEDIPYPDSSKEVGVLENIKSKGKNRDLYLPMSLLEEIDNFIMEERNNIDTEHSYIFVSQQKQFLGKHLTYRGIYEVFNTVKKKTGINLNFHDLRHTCATELVQSGMDISVVKIILGHEKISTTQQYTHISNAYVEDGLGRYWGNSIFSGGDLNS